MPKLTIDETKLLFSNCIIRLDNAHYGHYRSLFLTDFKVRSIHVAILVEPYLSLILKGEKTIESRFTKNRIAPFWQAKAGDIILLKKSGGGIVGVAEIDKSEFWMVEPESSYCDMSEVFDFTTINRLKNQHNDQICATPEFWESKQESRYASLLWLKNVATLSEPIHFKQSGRSAWLKLS